MDPENRHISFPRRINLLFAMASTMTHVVTVVGFVLVINFFNVSYVTSINVGEYIN
jgi:hypothetical protein